MMRTSQIAISVSAALVFSTAAALAQSPGQDRGPHAAGHGPMMMGQGMQHAPGAGNRGHMGGPTAMLTRQDENSAADMRLVMDLVHSHTQIRRTVTRLPDGIRTVTESDDPKVAQAIKAHVASMSARLKDGREFNLFSTTLPVIFDNAAQIESVVEMTDKGAIVTRTSTDVRTAAALQAHAGEVTELVRDGMAGMRRGMMARMAMGPGGPRDAIRAQAGQADRGVPASQHAH